MIISRGWSFLFVRFMNASMQKIERLILASNWGHIKLESDASADPADCQAAGLPRVEPDPLVMRI